MSRPFSRPRTRIYDANYNIGQNYYRPTLDRIDRKYAGRPLTPPARAPSVPQDLLDRHDSAFVDDSIADARTRAAKRIQEKNLFDSKRATSVLTAGMGEEQDEFEREMEARLERIRANKKVSIIDEIDSVGTLDDAMNSIKARRLKTRAEKHLDAVGIESIEEPKRDERVVFSRKVVRIAAENGTVDDGPTRWSKLENEDEKISSAAIRARQSKVRLSELEDEMNAMAEKTAMRERRAARLKQFVAENAEENEMAATNQIRIRKRAMESP